MEAQHGGGAAAKEGPMPSRRTLEKLATSKPRFLAFLRSQLGDPVEAEDFLQAAYLEASQRSAPLRAEESSVAWFYQLPRNALVDLHRARARGAAPADLEDADEAALGLPPGQFQAAVRVCLEPVVDTLGPAHARLLRRVDLEGTPVPAVAVEEGITPNNSAGVRLHRARAALRDRLRRVCGACSRHGCLDCACPPAFRAAP
jgi:RNA polymerase sigma-70 factor (ECF subfamily)